MRPTKSTFALFAALLLALLTLALAPAREGAKLLINDLFSLSESANAYVYNRLPVAASASRLPACALLGGALAFLSAAVALSQNRLPALLALVTLALGQAYFGLPRRDGKRRNVVSAPDGICDASFWSDDRSDCGGIRIYELREQRGQMPRCQ